MRDRHYKRTVERIRLLPPLDGAAGDKRLELTEISMGGVRLQHYEPLQVGTKISLRFQWEDEEATIPAVIVRCSVERFGANSVYLSGARFEYPDSTSKTMVKRMIGYHVKQALDNQIANAAGKTVYSSRLIQEAALGIPGSEHAIHPAFYALRDEGYVRYTYDQGRWTRTRTWEPEQPEDGFTIWHFEDDEQSSLLCKDYENASREMRAVIRLCAELSLFVDDSVPPQKFVP